LAALHSTGLSEEYEAQSQACSAAGTTNDDSLSAKRAWLVSPNRSTKEWRCVVVRVLTDQYVRERLSPWSE
jgi:hypothetical protein